MNQHPNIRGILRALYKLIEVFGLIIVYVFYLLNGQDNNRRNLAVYEFEACCVSSYKALVISDRIRIEIDKLGVYHIIERGLAEDVLNEQAFQLTGASILFLVPKTRVTTVKKRAVSE